MNDFQSIDRSKIGSNRLEVMNFLNEVSGNYPEAISFASGRPAESFFRVERWLGTIPDFVNHYARTRSIDREAAMALLAQYGRTNGVINDLIAQQVGIDEGIGCNGSQVITTAGCQEAIALCITALCREPGDVVLVRSPTYIGVSGAAELHHIELAAIVCDDSAQLATELELVVTRLREAGKRPRALYLTPDFDNPTGSVLSKQTREDLLAYCAREGLIILEDNPYGMFCYDGQRLPTLAALDQNGCTVYLGTYSKTLCPALRVGFIVVPEQLLGSAIESAQLIERISVAKSFLTCNTSQFMQAVVGGVLLSEQCSLAGIVQPARSHYQWNLEVMSDQLHTTLGRYGSQVQWNRPSGGFFMTVTLPFEFLQPEVTRCAEQFGAIVMPLSFFALTDDHNYTVRLAFSNLQPEQIKDGIDAFANFVKTRM